MRQHLQREHRSFHRKFSETMRSFLVGSLTKDPASGWMRVQFWSYSVAFSRKGRQGTAATPPVQPSAQAAAPRPAQASTAGTPSVSSVSSDTPQCPQRSPCTNTTPRQARADRSRHDPAHQEPLPAVREQLGAPGEPRTLLAGTSAAQSAALELVTPICCAGCKRCASEIDPPTPPLLPSLGLLPQLSGAPRGAAPPPWQQMRRGQNLQPAAARSPVPKP